MIGLAASCNAQTNQMNRDQPDASVIAVVLRKNISATQENRLDSLILNDLFDNYAKENKIEAPPEEIDAFVKKIQKESQKPGYEHIQKEIDDLQQELKTTTLTDQQRKQKEVALNNWEKILYPTPQMQSALTKNERLMAEHWVKNWKISTSLYLKYGGRVIFQQSGPEPHDALRDFLKYEEKRGAFKILDHKYEDRFWNYYTNDTIHIFLSKEEGDKALSTPFWLVEKQDSVKTLTP